MVNRPRDPSGLEARKHLLEQCMARYLAMRKASRLTEASAELQKASRLADESVEYTIRALRQLLTRIEGLIEEMDDEGFCDESLWSR